MSRPQARNKYPQHLLDKLERLQKELKLARSKKSMVEIVSKDHEIKRLVAELEDSV